jgi:hypothetical protein
VANPDKKQTSGRAGGQAAPERAGVEQRTIARELGSGGVPISKSYDLRVQLTPPAVVPTLNRDMNMATGAK